VFVDVRRFEAAPKGADVCPRSNIADRAVAGYVGEEDLARCAGLRQCQGEREGRAVMRGQPQAGGQRKSDHRANAGQMGAVERGRPEIFPWIVSVRGGGDEVLISRDLSSVRV